MRCAPFFSLAAPSGPCAVRWKLLTKKRLAVADKGQEKVVRKVNCRILPGASAVNIARASVAVAHRASAIVAAVTAAEAAAEDLAVVVAAVDVVDHAEERGVEDLVVQAAAVGRRWIWWWWRRPWLWRRWGLAAAAAGAVVMAECLQRVIPKAADTEDLHSWQRTLERAAALRRSRQRNL